MKFHEFMLELADKPAEFTTTINDDYCEVSAPTIGLELYLIRGLSHTMNNDRVSIEFSVNGRRDLTGAGNQIKILSTVSAMLNYSLKKFINRHDRFIMFSADRSEPSRVRFYATRAVPEISRILKTINYNWQPADLDYPDHDAKIYAWEKI